MLLQRKDCLLRRRTLENAHGVGPQRPRHFIGQARPNHTSSRAASHAPARCPSDQSAALSARQTPHFSTAVYILRNLGWEILRVWSPDWWYDNERAIETLDHALKGLLEESRETNSPDMEKTAEGSVSEDGSISPAVETDAVAKPTRTYPTQAQQQSPTSNQYIQTDLGDHSGSADRFHDDDYASDLQEMVAKGLEQEAPVREDLLAQRIARSHGFARTGAKIKDRVFSLLNDIQSTEESVGRFLWHHLPAESTPFRPHAQEEDRRSVDEISLPEFCGLITSNREYLTEADAVVPIARTIGLSRIAKSARSRIEEAIEYARCLLQSQDDNL